MNSKELLKKYWFLGIVALGLLAYFIVYAVQSYNARPVYVDTKTDGEGKSIVYTINGENYLADDLYEDLYNDVGAYTAYSKWSRAVIDAAVKNTDDITTYANNYAQYIAYYNDQATIDSTLKSYGYAGGYDDLAQYCLDIVKADALYKEFYSNNYDTYVKQVVEAKHPKKVYHILVKVADVQEVTDEAGNTIKVANMTAEEEAKLNAVIEALKTEDYDSVCAQYSDEDSTKENGGYLGIYDDETIASTMVSEFANAVIVLPNGSVSEPVLSEFGYHFIRVEEPTEDEIKEDTQFMSEVSNYYSYSNVLAIKEKSDELGFTIVDEKLLSAVNEYVELAKEEIASGESEVNE